MFRKYTVPAPSVPRRIRVKKNGNGSRYVDYEVGRKYYREKKYNVPVRKTIGLLDYKDETRMYPNDNYFESFAVRKAPEHLTEKQRDTLDGIRRGNSRYYRAYEIKETLRLILRCTDRDEADRKLKEWYWWASHSRIDSFKELAKKIRRNREFILNTISHGLSNARIEATNNKIKLLIRRSYGFRNIDSMLNMIYLTCSDLKIPLPNRPEGEVIAV